MHIDIILILEIWSGVGLRYGVSLILPPPTQFRLQIDVQNINGLSGRNIYLI